MPTARTPQPIPLQWEGSFLALVGIAAALTVVLRASKAAPPSRS